MFGAVGSTSDLLSRRLVRQTQPARLDLSSRLLPYSGEAQAVGAQDNGSTGATGWGSRWLVR